MRGVEKTAGSANAQGMGNFKAGRWSGDNHIWWTGAKPGDTLTMTFDVPAAGEYEIFAAMTKAVDYGVFDVLINDRIAIADLDLFNGPAVVSTGPLSLGTHKLVNGENKVRIVIKGANPKAAKKYMFGLDYLYLAKPGPVK